MISIELLSLRFIFQLLLKVSERAHNIYLFVCLKSELLNSLYKYLLLQSSEAYKLGSVREDVVYLFFFLLENLVVQHDGR